MRGTHLLLTALLVGVLAGCTPASTSAPTSEAGFVSGDGTLKVLPVDQRKPAPEVVGKTLTGQIFDLAKLKGSVVVLNVWGSWCGPCRAEAPILEATYKELASKKVTFIGLNTRESPAPAQAFVRNFSITYPNISDPQSQLLLGFRGTLPPAAIPSTLVIDKQGRVAARIIGPVDSQTTLENLINDVVAQ
ncbi:unannotated protein [freshwater metagenome]|uniref:Unannotated protein n=1 Tax=freshwater metagenome TaxID=449393 RepID=A0A6J7CLI6_9ZZZZ|nr:redoxin domain-containing protein [Actinomycetota bacterium]